MIRHKQVRDAVSLEGRWMPHSEGMSDVEKKVPTDLPLGQSQPLSGSRIAGDASRAWRDHQARVQAPAETHRRKCGFPKPGQSADRSARLAYHLQDQGAHTDPGQARRGGGPMSCSENGGDLMVVVDAEGLISHVCHGSPDFASIAERIVGASVYSILAPACHAGMRESIEYVLRTGRATRRVVCLSAENSAFSICEARLGPIGQNGHTAAVGVFLENLHDHNTLSGSLGTSEALLASVMEAVPMTLEMTRGLLRYGVSIAKLVREEREISLYKQHMVQLGRLMAVGQVSTSLVQKLPQFLTTIGLSIENALAESKTPPRGGGIKGELEAALEGVSTLANVVEQACRLARTQPEARLVHAVDVRDAVVKMVGLLEARAQQVGTTICVDALGEVAPVRMAEGDAEQLVLSLLENLIWPGCDGEHRCVSVGAWTSGRLVELRFSGYRDPAATADPGRFDGGPSSDATTATMANMSLRVARDVVACAGGQISSEHAPDGHLTFSVALPRADQACSEAG